MRNPLGLTYTCAFVLFQDVMKPAVSLYKHGSYVRSAANTHTEGQTDGDLWDKQTPAQQIPHTAELSSEVRPKVPVETFDIQSSNRPVNTSFCLNRQTATQSTPWANISPEPCPRNTHTHTHNICKVGQYSRRHIHALAPPNGPAESTLSASSRRPNCENETSGADLITMRGKRPA